MEMRAVIQARPEGSKVLDGMGGGGAAVAGWPSLTQGKRPVKPVRCSVAAYWITLSYITFKTRLSVSISFYKYGVLLETEMRVMAGNSDAVFKSKFSVKLYQNLNNLLWGTQKRAEPHGCSIILRIHRTTAIKTTVSKIRRQHTTTG